MSYGDVLRGSVGPQGNVADGLNPIFRQGKSGEQVVTELHGKFFEQTIRGNVYLAKTPAAGVVIPKYDATAQVFAIWNKSTSVNLVPLRFTLNHVGTPSVSGNIGFVIHSVGQALATGNLSAFADSAVFNTKTLQAAVGLNGKLGLAVTTTIAGTDANYIPMGLSSAGVLAAATTTTPWSQLIKDFDGEFVVPPGYLIGLVGNVAQTNAFAASLSWEEVPV